MENALYSLLFFVALVGVDWALIDGFRRSILTFRKVPEYYNYRYFAFPRMILVFVFSVTLYFGSQTNVFGQHGTELSFVSAGMFLLTCLYPQAVMLFNSRPY
jgi:hypothetical protein